MLLLCRTLHRTVAELESEMDAEEFALWQAEYQRRPWGEERADIREAWVGANLKACWSESVKVEDLIPAFDGPTQMDRWKQYVAEHNARRQQGDSGQ